jgi:hypothetical protein
MGNNTNTEHNTLDVIEKEKSYLKQEILEKENYLNSQKLKFANEIKNTLDKTIFMDVAEKKDNKIKAFFKKLFNTCK